MTAGPFFKRQRFCNHFFFFSYSFLNEVDFATCHSDHGGGARIYTCQSLGFFYECMPGEENQITKPVPHIRGGYERYPSGQPASGNLARGPKIGLSTQFGPPGVPQPWSFNPYTLMGEWPCSMGLGYSYFES